MPSYRCCRCDRPLEYPMEGPCGVCDASFLTMIRSAIVYDDGSKRLFLRFKHGDDLSPLPLLVQWCLTISSGFWDTFPDAVLMPIPLHPRRLWTRQYNQAALLANTLSPKVRLPVVLNALKRHRNTSSQGHLSYRERFENVHGAFSVKGPIPKHIILIDDILTSGATGEACAEALLEAGAKKVALVTVARALT